MTNVAYEQVVRGRGRFVEQPYWNVIDYESQKSALHALIDKGVRRSEKHLMGEMLSAAIDPEGGLNYIRFSGEGPRDKSRYSSMLREMIDTAQGQMALLEKVRIDVAFGLAETPLLYGPIFERIAPPGGFPGGAFQIDEYTLTANVVFLQKFEGGEVEFGTLAKGAPAVGLIQTYAAGFEWTEDMIEFDRTWSVELNNRAFGRSYNALLNHLHLSVITGYAYAAANQTPADATAGASLAERTHRTFQSAYTTSVMATPRRTGTVLLASEANRFQIEEALLTPVLDADGRPLPNVPINTIIYYDGEDIERGSDVFNYPGVTAGKCYLIFPRRKLKELVHHDLRIDIGPPDISRLVEGQQVGRARRGVYATIEESVEEVTLPV